MFVGLAVLTDISCRNTDTGFISCAFPVHRLSPLPQPESFSIRELDCAWGPQTLHDHTRFSRPGDLAPGIFA